MKNLKEAIQRANEDSSFKNPTDSAIGSGTANIFRGSSKDSLAIIARTSAKEVYVAKDIADGVSKYNTNVPPVLVVKGPSNVLWAIPITKDGQVNRGMFSGAFIHASDNNVMKGYNHPIRLMDRYER